MGSANQVHAGIAMNNHAAEGNFLTRYLLSHPKGFWFFFWGELAERASYYGTRAILFLYMTEQLGFKPDNASTTLHFYLAACYFLPLVGGFVADRYLGKYWTIVGFSVPYVVGQVLVGFGTETYLIVAMLLLAMGSGVIKPNISTLMGLTYDQQRPGQDRLRSDAFAMFYGAINIGSTASILAVPWIRTRYGYLTAFLFPAGLMAVALAVFALGKRYYAVEVISRHEKTPQERSQQWAVLSRLLLLFLLVTFFWAIFDQQSSTWVAFAKDYLHLSLFGMKMDPDQLQALNAIFILAFLPLVTLFWNYAARKGHPFRATDKMTIGFALTALTMAIHAGAAYVAVQNGVRVSLWWQVVAYVMITFAEICISVTGLELAFTAAPKSMKGFVTACWLVTVGCANLFIDAPITRLYPSSTNSSTLQFKTPYGYFAMLTGVLLVVTVAFVFVARQFNRTAVHEDEPKEDRPVTERAPAEA
jgi:POT family proton-dependent oligopeptide transporter